MQHNIMAGMAGFYTILCVASMGVILHLSVDKTITISEVVQDEMQNEPRKHETVDRKSTL